MSETLTFREGSRLIHTREQFPIPEACDILGGIRPVTLMRDIRLGKIRVRRYGRRIFVPRSELERILREGFPTTEAR